MKEKHVYDSWMATNKAKLMVYLEQSYKNGLEKLAELENRSMSNFVETLIQEVVDKARSEGKIPSIDQKQSISGSGK